MGGEKKTSQPGTRPAAATGDIDIELDQLSTANIDDLRAVWRERNGSEAPAALSKDLIARALSYAVQEKQYDGLEPRLRRLLDREISSGTEPDRYVKVGSIIVREHDGIVHEVMVVPGGFCWEGKVYGSLSTIAKRITGTSWNGPRFFGLRGKEKKAAEAGEHVSDVARIDANELAVGSGRVPIRKARRRSKSKAAS